MLAVEAKGSAGRVRDVVVRPTAERRRHGVLCDSKGVCRVVNTVQSMYDSQDIGDDELAAADRWYREYLFATTGVVEEMPSDGRFREKGDMHTWMMGRGKCSARISAVREALGLAAHVRLEMLLAREMTFSAMARHIYPGLSEGRARMKVSAQCSLVLEQLVHVYGRLRGTENKKYH